MAQYINFETAEHVERSVARRISAGDGFTEATGNRETVMRTGPWAVELAALNALVGGNGIEVTAELERLPGGIGELRITREEYKQPAATEEEEEGGGGSAEAPLGTEDNPSFSSNGTLVPVSILCHPKFKDLSEKELRALKAMLDGQDENSLLSDDDSNATAGKRIKDMITSDAGKKAMKHIRQGRKEWVETHTQVTLRWKASSNKYTLRSIVSHVSGVTTPSGCNWRVDGVGTDEQGGERWQTATLTLSGDGGWDKDLYGNES